MLDATARRLGHRIVRDNGRLASVFDDDAYLVSYPRSGNTWVSFLISNLVARNSPTTFANLERRCPDVYVSDDRTLRQIPRPRLLKSHEHFHPRYRRVIYLVRDPRDVAGSYLRFLKKVRAMPLEATIDDFLSAFLDGTVDEFGAWGHHAGSWIGARRDDPDFLLVRYEDIHAETLSWLMRIADFLSIPANEADCERAIALSAPDEMRRLEREQAATVAEFSDTRLDVPFIGAARVGKWREELSPQSADAIVARWGGAMAELGYVASEAIA